MALANNGHRFSVRRSCQLKAVSSGSFQARPFAIPILQLIPPVGQLVALRGGPRPPVTVDDRHGRVLSPWDPADRELDQPLLGERLVRPVGQRHRQLPELIGHHGQVITGAEVIPGGGHRFTALPAATRRNPAIQRGSQRQRASIATIRPQRAERGSERGVTSGHWPELYPGTSPPDRFSVLPASSVMGPGRTAERWNRKRWGLGSRCRPGSRYALRVITIGPV